MAATRVKEVWNGHVYDWLESPLLLATFRKHLGTEETRCQIFGRGMLSCFCPIGDSRCSTVLDLLFCTCKV